MTLLIIEAATSRAKSPNSAKTTTKHAKGPIRFYLDTRNESAATLTGEGLSSYCATSSSP